MKKLVLLIIIILLIGCDNENNLNHGQKNVIKNDPINEMVIEEEENINVENMDKTFNVMVGVDDLKIRADFKIDSEILGIISKDTVLTVRETILDVNDNLWYKVVSDEIEGYVASWFTIDHINYRTLRIHDEEDDLIGFFSFDDINFENVQPNFRIMNQLLYREYEAVYKGEDVIVYREVYPIETLSNNTDMISFNTEVGLESITTVNPTIKIESIAESTFFMEFVGLYDSVAYILSPNGLLYFENTYLLNSSRNHVFRPIDSSVSIYSIKDNLTQMVDFSSSLKDAFVVGEDLFVTLEDDQQYVLKLVKGEWLKTEPDSNMTFVYKKVANTFQPKDFIDDKILEDALTTNWYVVKDDHLLQVKSLNYNEVKYFAFTEIDTSIIHKLKEDLKVYHNGTVYKIPKGEYSAFYFDKLGNNDEQYLLSFNYFESKTSDYFFLKHYYLNPKAFSIIELGNICQTSPNNEMLLAGNILNDGIGIDELKILDIASGLEMIYLGHVKCSDGAEVQFNDMWQQDNLVTYSSISDALGGWDALGSIDSTIKTTIDPVNGLMTINNQTIHSKDMTLKFYDTLLDRVPRNDYKIKTESLIFTGTISVIGNDLVAWFEHPIHGYTYRMFKESERTNFNLSKEIKIIDSNKTTYQFFDPLMTMSINSVIKNDFIEVKLYGKDSDFYYVRFIHKDKGYSIDSQDFTASEVSEDGQFMFVVAEYLQHDYFAVQIVNIETDVIEYKVDELSDHYMNDQFRYREMTWHDDTTIYLLYDNSLEDIADREMMLKRIEGRWELLERD